MALLRTVNGIRLIQIGPGSWESPDGLFRFVREDRSGREGALGWYVRALLGDHADPDGQYEPLVLDNGLSWAPTLRETVAYAYRLKWTWLRNGMLKREELRP